MRDIAELVVAQENMKQVPHGQMMDRLVHVARHVILNRRQYVRLNEFYRLRRQLLEDLQKPRRGLIKPSNTAIRSLLGPLGRTFSAYRKILCLPFLNLSM